MIHKIIPIKNLTKTPWMAQRKLTTNGPKTISSKETINLKLPSISASSIKSTNKKDKSKKSPKNLSLLSKLSKNSKSQLESSFNNKFKTLISSLHTNQIVTSVLIEPLWPTRWKNYNDCRIEESLLSTKNGSRSISKKFSMTSNKSKPNFSTTKRPNASLKIFLTLVKKNLTIMHKNPMKPWFSTKLNADCCNAY